MSTWNLTVYYTALESFHTDSPITIYGHIGYYGQISGGKISLGSFPYSFTKKVKNEGTGRITAGKYTGKYLNWSYDTGYWVDVIPCNSYGQPLVPFVTCAADQTVLPVGTHVKITACGSDSTSGDPCPSTTCTAFKNASWVVEDEFTPGLGGTNHIDLYVGEENIPHFERDSDLWVDLSGAQITIT